MIIAPSLLAMDLTLLNQQIEEVEATPAKWLHLDVMDGHFVPNLSYGPDFVRQIRKITSLFLDVHIMVSNPEFFAPIFIEAGADLITFHVEASQDVKSLIKMIKQKGRKVGISLKPQTRVEDIFPYLMDVDLVLVMTVEPGFGGQSFMKDSVGRIQAIRKEMERIGAKVILEVDGGINDVTAKLCVAAGANALVAGSYIFLNNIEEAIHSLWTK